MPLEPRFCLWCEKGFWFEAAPSMLRKGSGKYCSRSCSMKAQLTGKRSRNWKGGRYTKRGGYVSIYVPNHPAANANGRVSEHRLVMEAKLGRYLKPYEIVHHLNGNPSDNKPENLAVMTQREHMHVHNVQARKERLEFAWYLNE